MRIEGRHREYSERDKFENETGNQGKSVVFLEIEIIRLLTKSISIMKREEATKTTDDVKVNRWGV